MEASNEICRIHCRCKQTPMPKPKPPSRAEAIRQTLTHAQTPLTFDELLAGASANFPMDAKQLRAGLESLYNGDYHMRRVLQQSADGRYGWLSRFVAGARFQHTLTADELKKQYLNFEVELATGLFPMLRGYHERIEPCEGVLPDGARVTLNIEPMAQTSWSLQVGTRAEKNFWTWLTTQDGRVGDALVFHIESARPPRCAVFLQPASARDAACEQERNDLVAETISIFLKPKQNGMYLADIAARLLALGSYHDACPPAALESILQHDARFRLERGEWKIATRADLQYAAPGLEHDGFFDPFGEARKRPKRKHPPKKELENQVYRFVASFRHNKGRWRRIEIAGDQTLRQFDKIMREAFGHDAWDHLSEFYLGTNADAYKRGLGAHSPHEGSSADNWLVGELGLEPNDTLSYTYDFGDNIQHVLKVEALVLRERGVEYPRVIEQNKPRYRYCGECKEEGKKEIATWVCLDCSNDQGEAVFVCEEHAADSHEDHFTEEMIY